MLTTLLSIGHGAYSGTNALMQFRTQRGCVKELVARGVNPETAQKAVAEAASRPYGYGHVTGFHGNVIEIRNDLDQAQANHWPVLRYGLDEWKRARTYALIRRGPMPSSVPFPF